MQTYTAYFIGDKFILKTEVYNEVIYMKIKRMPESKRVILSRIPRGECFMILEDFDINEDDCVNEGDLFLCVGNSTIKDRTQAVKLEFGSLYDLPNTLFVEKVNAHIVCE